MRTLTFGETLWDLIDGVAHLGGGPFNLAANLARMGAESHIVSCVGRDEFGARALADAEALGVRTTYISTSDTLPTSVANVVLGPDGMPAYEIGDNAAWDAMTLSPEELRSIFERKWDMFCFGTLAQRSESNQELLDGIFAELHSEHVFFDANLRQNFYSRQIIEKSLLRSSIVKLNMEEAEALAVMFLGGMSDVRSFMLGLSSKFGLPLICVTKGPGGASVFFDGICRDVAGVPVPVVDSVGAGAAFSAAFIFAFMNGSDPFYAAEFGCRLASHVVSRRGALPEYSESILGEIGRLARKS